MKKLLGILVLGLLMSGNVYSNETYIIKSDNKHVWIKQSKSTLGNRDNFKRFIVYAKEHCVKLNKNTYAFSKKGKQDLTYGWGFKKKFEYRYICASNKNEAIANMIYLVNNSSDSSEYVDKVRNVGSVTIDDILFSSLDFQETINSNLNNNGNNQKQSQSIEFNIKQKKEQCTAIGFKPETEKFADCVLRLVELDVKTQQNNQIAAAQNSGNQQLADELKKQRDMQTSQALINLGQQLMKPKQNNSNIYFPQTKRCTIQGFGSFAKMTCR